MQRLRRLALLVVTPLVVATGPVVATAWASPAGASSPGPVQIPLVAGSPPGVTCPSGTYVASNPGPTQSPVFVLSNPGPINCPPGADVLTSPGPTQAPTGQAVALPLTAKSCAVGTALFNQELTMIGGTPPPGGVAPTHKAARRAAGCPSGDAALAALHAALANVPGDPGGKGFITPGSFGLPAVQRGFLTVDPGPISAPALTGSFQTNAWIFYYFNHSDGSHQLIVFHPARSGLTKIKLAQFSPVVTTQPVSQSLPEGSSITFTSSAVGNPFPTVQWQFSMDGGTSWHDAIGETSTTSTTGAIYSFEKGWEVRAVFTNSLGSATSNPATLTVTP
jgi:hypothetical protein